MTLEVDNISTVRAIGDFVDARIAHVGFKSISDFTRKSGLTRPTVDRVLKAKTEADVRGYRATRERVARFLKFGEWRDLVEAWKDGEPRRGLDAPDIVLIEFPKFAWDHAISEAEKEGITPTEWIVGEILPPAEFERRPIPSSDTTPPPGQGTGPRKRG